MTDATPITLPPASKNLTYDECVKIGGALQRLNEIKEGSIIKLHTPKDGGLDTRKEAESLIEYLSETLIKHAGELVGCWLVVKGELQPLIQALMPIVQRVNTHLAAQLARNIPAPETKENPDDTKL